LARRFQADQSGATAIEYGLIVAGIALAIIAVVNGLGSRLGVEHVRQVARVIGMPSMLLCKGPAVWRMENRTYAPGTYLAETTFL
jgi:pilus assembly protein Flp/PilA